MSVGQIQQRDLFDEDDDDNSAAAAGGGGDNAVNNPDVGVYSNTVPKNSNSHSSSSGSDENGRQCQWRYVLTVILLTAVNLLNYMDRFSVAGLFSRFTLFTYLL